MGYESELMRIKSSDVVRLVTLEGILSGKVDLASFDVVSPVGERVRL